MNRVSINEGLKTNIRQPDSSSYINLIIQLTINDCSVRVGTAIDLNVCFAVRRAAFFKVNTMRFKLPPVPARNITENNKNKMSGLSLKNPGSTHRRLPVCIAIACIYSSTVHALPQNPATVSGAVTMTTAGGDMQVNQTSDKAVINWQKFGIARNESLTFTQPSASSVILNRVVGSEASAVDGMLKANGQVFIINPNGVLFGRTASVNVGGLVASTLDIDDQRFLSSDYRFSSGGVAGGGSVSNAGSLTATAVDGGYIVMLSDKVSNTGDINASSGQVLMGGASQATLYISKQSLLGYQIDSGTAAALVENAGNIRADGGTVSLLARGLTGAEQVASAAVNNSGIIEAKTLHGKPGAIVLSGDMQSGRVSVSGKLDASAKEGNGGNIDTSAATVLVGASASITTDAPAGVTGLWTISSANPVIGQSRNSIDNMVLSRTLEKSNVTVAATGNGEEKDGILSVNEAIRFGGKNSLVLKSAYHLFINAPISTGAGGLVAHAGVNGTGEGKLFFLSDVKVSASNGGSVDIYTNVSDYTKNRDYDGFITTPYRLWMLVNNVSQLQQIQTNLSGNYAINRDIDASETAAWNKGMGFNPIGMDKGRFSGQLDGMNHVIANLYINRPHADSVGLFSESTGTIRNLGLQNVNIVGNSSAGAFAGYNGGMLTNVYATGNVSVEVEAGYSEQATAIAGGLVGTNGKSGVIKDAYSLVNVGGRSTIGGIAGYNDGTLENVYAAGKVGSTNGADELFMFGGLAGMNAGKIKNSYFTSDGTGKNLAYGRNSGTVDTVTLNGALTNESLTSAQLAFDYGATWFRYDNYTAPLLRSFLKPLTINSISQQIDKVYDGTNMDLQLQFFYSTPDAATSPHLNASNSPANYSRQPGVGTYTNDSTTVFWSDQQGYLIKDSVVSGKKVVNITPRPITIQANSDTKEFDNSANSQVSPGISGMNSANNMGLAEGNVLVAKQSFDSNEAGDRLLKIFKVEIKNKNGMDVTSNYQVTRLDAKGQIKLPRNPDSGGGTVIVPPVDGQPGNVPDNTGGGKTGGGGTGGTGAGGTGGGTGGGGTGGGGTGSGGTGGGSTGGGGTTGGGAGGGGSTDGSNTGSAVPSQNSKERQQFFDAVAYVASGNEDDNIKKALLDKKLKNDSAFEIRNGGIRLPVEISVEN